MKSFSEWTKEQNEQLYLSGKPEKVQKPTLVKKGDPEHIDLEGPAKKNPPKTTPKSRKK